MADPQTVIEINGKKYNAQTGQPIAKQKPNKVPTNQVIDGFKKPDKTATPTKIRTATTPNNAATAHNEPQSTNRLQKSLQRKAATAPVKADPKVRATSGNRAGGINKTKLQSANEQRKSSFISKFSPQAPVATQAPTPNPKPVQIPQNEVPGKPPKSPNPEDGADKPKKRKFFGVFKNRRPKRISMVGAVAAILLLAGYITYLNLPKIALRVAASRSGFSATLPGYTPSGFSFDGPIAYSPGQMTIQYGSNTDERSFQITERKSSWDSQSLLDNHVVGESEHYLTFQERGLTVYVYDGSTATWVDGGIWYTVDGDSKLNSEQLLKLASSL